MNTCVGWPAYPCIAPEPMPRMVDIIKRTIRYSRVGQTKVHQHERILRQVSPEALNNYTSRSARRPKPHRGWAIVAWGYGGSPLYELWRRCDVICDMLSGCVLCAWAICFVQVRFAFGFFEKRMTDNIVICIRGPGPFMV